MTPKPCGLVRDTHALAWVNLLLLAACRCCRYQPAPTGELELEAEVTSAAGGIEVATSSQREMGRPSAVPFHPADRRGGRLRSLFGTPSSRVSGADVSGKRAGMSVVKSLWASVQGDPVFMRRVNGWFTIFWILMIPFSIAFGLLSSVSYVSALSLWALVSGHWSAWQAARVEVEQHAQAEELAKHPVEKRVVDRLVAETVIDRTAVQPTTSPLDEDE